MPKLTLLAKFSVTSFVLLAAIGVLLGNALTRHFEQQAIEQQKAGVSSLVPPVVGPFLSDELMSKGAQGETYKHIESAFSYLGGSGLVRVKVVNKKGMIVYSDDASLVGAKAANTEEMWQALDGVSAASIVEGGSSENIEDLGYGELLVVYTPLRKAGETEISGVFEGFYDVGDLQQTINDTSGFLWSSIGAGFVFLYISLFTLVRNASHTLRQQSKDNEQLYKEAQQRLTEREAAERRTQLQVERLKALRNIDVAISSNLDLRLTLHVILAQVCTQLRVDAACILLLNKQTETMEYVAGRGFRSDGIDRIAIRLGEGYTGRTAEQQHQAPKVVTVLSGRELNRPHLLAEEEFVSYSVASLVVKGQVKGVLEIFHRSALEPDEEWLGFFEALAGQSAIAVENATLFEELQRSNTELSQAYDNTLEGWSRALDLRDEETEGHSRRVTDMTMKLARQVGVPESELVHIRRGALLHDIGKMGIPDAVLLKPGPLTEEEWKIMRQHPTYAYLLLSPITFLRPALDIPYCHHEKWDGSGYPRRLKGEEIPLAARIFAVVDVWDALGSNRPYRKAMEKERIYDYLQEQAGKHFDPTVVAVFLSMEKADLSMGRMGRTERQVATVEAKERPLQSTARGA
jgi:putative nucleotidyltransferase with HDIG domain